MPNTRALQLSIEGLLKLLGGSPEDRLRFWEILKGITTPRENILVNSQLEAMAASIKQITVEANVLKTTAKQISK
jgi:hypothetical protein